MVLEYVEVVAGPSKRTQNNPWYAELGGQLLKLLRGLLRTEGHFFTEPGLLPIRVNPEDCKVFLVVSYRNAYLRIIHRIFAYVK